MRRHHKEETPPPVGWVEIARVTATGASTVNIPAGYSSIGLWIVGGGGSGASEHYKANSPGCGGNGGQAMEYVVQNDGSALSVSVVVGTGGPQTSTGTNKTGSNGGVSSVTINGTTYSAEGGRMAPGGNYSGTPTKVQYSGRGGAAWGYSWPGTGYPDPDIVGRYPDGFVANGENGLPNPFDATDTNLYGGGGGGGFDSYRTGGSHPNDSFSYGGETGGASGGGGRNNNVTNAGGNATFYGGGGGGGAFSSNHRYGAGGAGYQGIVIIYGKTS